MKRRFVRWCIRVWLDSESPRWLRQLVRGDPELEEYESRQREMVARLRRDAPAWRKASALDCPAAVDEQPPGVRAVARSGVDHSRSRRAALPLAAAAALVVVIVLLGVGRAPHEDGTRVIGGNAPSQHAAPAELLRVYEAAQGLVQRSVDRVASLTPEVPNPEAVNALMIAPLETASRVYGQTLALVRHSLREQRTQAASQTRQALRGVLRGLRTEKSNGS